MCTSTYCVLGDGSRCRFWSDHWLEPESIHHLPVGCSFSSQLWHELLSWCRCTPGPPQLDNWFQDCNMTSCVTAPSLPRKGSPACYFLAPDFFGSIGTSCLTARHPLLSASSTSLSARPACSIFIDHCCCKLGCHYCNKPLRTRLQLTPTDNRVGGTIAYNLVATSLI